MTALRPLDTLAQDVRYALRTLRRAPLFTAIAIGTLAALATTRVLSFLLYDVGAGDPAVLAGVAALLVGVMLLACWAPVRRATRVEPLAALKSVSQ